MIISNLVLIINRYNTNVVLYLMYFSLFSNKIFSGLHLEIYEFQRSPISVRGISNKITIDFLQSQFYFIGVVNTVWWADRYYYLSLWPNSYCSTPICCSLDRPLSLVTYLGEAMDNTFSKIANFGWWRVIRRTEFLLILIAWNSFLLRREILKKISYSWN